MVGVIKGKDTDKVVRLPYASTTPKLMHGCGHSGHTRIALGMILPPLMTSDDFGLYLAKVAGCYIFISDGTQADGRGYLPLHHLCL